jgi:hypothetical protein
MTRKDYELIAAAIRATVAHVAVDPGYCEGWQAAASSAAHRVADSMANDDPRFDRARFLKACGLDS